MKKHDFGPTTLNHGNTQCRGCGCTDLEARYALGDDCPGRAPADRAPHLTVIEGGRKPVDGMDLDYGTPMDEIRNDHDA